MSEEEAGGCLEPIDVRRLSAAVQEGYHNQSLMTVNNHEVRLSVMTGSFRWHHHPDSDEAFLVLEGGLVIEFDEQEVTLRSGQLFTVPRGVRHRTRPEGARSVNLTFERLGAETIFEDGC